MALALIIAATVGPLTLATRGIFSTRFSRSKLVALNLAQEGVELIRSYRDNNILAGQPWDNSIGGALDTVTNWRADIICSAAPRPPAHAFYF